MAITSIYSWIQTAHYSAAHFTTLLLVLSSLSSTSRAASIGTVPTTCVCTTQVPTTLSPKFDITGSTPSFKEIPAGVSTVLLPPLQNKLTFTLKKKIKMSDEQVKSDGAQEVVVTKQAAPKEVEKAVQQGKHREDRKGNDNSTQDNIVFPKDDESVTPTSEPFKTTMPIGNRILIDGMPNDGYGRDANGEIVEIFQ